MSQLRRARAACALVAAMTVAACAAPAPAPAGARGELLALLDEQQLEAARFDEARTPTEPTAGDRCDILSHHLEKICALSDRICHLAAVHPEPTNQAACERSVAVCDRSVSQLPAECVPPPRDPPPTQ